MFEDRERARNIICIALAVIVVVGVGIFARISDRAEREYSAALQNMVEEARPYEEELRKLQEELKEQEGFDWSSGTAKIMVGFYVGLGTDIAFVRTQADEYGLEPVLILDCCQELDTLAYLTYMASGTGWEVMLTASNFSESMIEEALDVRTYLERYGLTDTKVFLFMDGDDSEENIQYIMDNGFIGYAKHDATSPSSGYTEDDLVYFDYALVQTTEELSTDGMEALFSDKSSMLIAFDMASIHAGTLTEQEVVDTLDTLQELSDQEEFLYSSVSNVTDELLQLGTLQADYDEGILQKQERVEELETIIDEIYSGFTR